MTPFDTSPLYGNGLSEHRFGHVLRRKPRDSFVLSTKVGRWMRPRPEAEIDRGWFKSDLNSEAVVDYSYDGTIRSLEQSFRRLGLNRIDVLLIHDVDVWIHGDDGYHTHFRTAMEGAYKALAARRAAGTIGTVGVGVNEIHPRLDFAAERNFDRFLLTGRYTLLKRAALEELLPALRAHGHRHHAGWSLQFRHSGNRRGTRNQVQLFSCGAGYAMPIAAASLRFSLGHPSVSSVIPGVISASEVERNRILVPVLNPTDLWDDLKQEGLMRASVPVPP